MRIARLASVAALGAVLAVPSIAAPAPSTAFVPLAAPAPAWYTPELHAQVMAAGPKGVTLPESIDIPTSSLAFAGIRPGQMIIVGAGNICSTNFVFGSKPNYSIGTAGHCGSVGQSVTMLFAPRVVANIGKIIKSTGDAGVGNDFALISILPAFQKQVSPSMAHWGGPNGSYSGPGAPLIVKHSGHGLVVGTGGTPRVGIGTLFSSTAWRFIGTITFGDSGSGAVAGNGKAIGNITHISVNFSPLGTAAGTSITRIKQIAGMSLALCGVPWPLYGCL